MSDAKQTGYAEEFKVLVCLTLANVTIFNIIWSIAKRENLSEKYLLFQRLELLNDCQSSGEEFVDAFKPSNLNKNRFSNIVPSEYCPICY